MNNIPNIIQCLGGATALAEQLGIPMTTVASWKQRQSIPVEHWPRLLEIATSQGIDLSYEQLVHIHTAAPAD
jgi:hypothetical protein